MARCLAGSLVKTLSQEIFVTSVVDLKLNFKSGHMYRKRRLCLQGDSSNAFPGKCFVQYGRPLKLEWWNRRKAQSQKGGKWPQILNDGIAKWREMEDESKSWKRWKIPRNLKRHRALSIRPNIPVWNSGYSMRRMEQYFPVRWTNQSQVTRFQVSRENMISNGGLFYLCLLDLGLLNDSEVEINDVLGEGDNITFIVRI